MSTRQTTLRLKELFTANIGVTVVGALMMAFTLYALVSLLTWLLHRTPGLTDLLANVASDFGVETSQLLEFHALIVGGIFIATQLWVTYRRVSAAENTAEAAIRTAESTVRSNAAQLFKNAVELLGSDVPIVQIGGIQALGFLARDYPEYQEAVAAIIDNYAQQPGANRQSEDDGL